MEQQCIDHGKQIIQNTQSAKSAHHRIDELKKDVQKNRDDIDILQDDRTELKTNMAGLTKAVSGLNVTIKWLIGLILSGSIGFIFWYIQQL